MRHFLYSPPQPFRVFVSELGKCTVFNMLSYNRHQAIIEMKIMQNRKSHAKHLSGRKQMSDIGP